MERHVKKLLVSLVVAAGLSLPCGGLAYEPVRRYLPQYWMDLKRLDSTITRRGFGKTLTAIISPEMVPAPDALVSGLKQPASFPASVEHPIDSSRFSSHEFVLRVLTANLLLLPPPFAADHDARLDEFARIVRGRNPDLIILQEVWLESYLMGLRRRLPEYEAFAPGPNIANPTGLAVFSRLPHVDTCFRFYPGRLDFNIEEKLAQKGFLAVGFSFGDKPFWIVNTHLYAHSDDLELGFTRAQFETVKDFCSSLPGAVILGGDMNMEPQELFPLLGGVFSAEPEGGRTAVRGAPNRRIDYVMTRSSHDWSLSARSEVVMEPVVSDHFPVFAEVTFRQKVK